MFDNVIWATDGSEHADRALAYAKQLAQHDGGTLHVVHVVEKLVGPRVAGQNAKLNEREIEGKIEDQARAAERDGLRVTQHVSSGHGGEIARRIVEEAASANADVIVAGTRGHSAAVAAVVGSVTQRLLHMADCPVLAVPPAHDARKQSEMGADTAAAAS